MKTEFSWMWKVALACALFAGFWPGTTTAQNPLDSVVVVPNPWNVSGRTLGPNGSNVWATMRFVRLPEPDPDTPTKIRIYTPACNLVTEFEHEEGQTAIWKGRNDDNEYVVSGLYIYVIEHATLGTKSGKLIIIR